MSRRIKNLFKFSAPKTIGFGINRNYYLTVLTGQANMPSINDLFDQKGKGSKVHALMAPLAGSTDRAILDNPIGRGTYALASPDRKTVIKTMVLTKEEVGFNPDQILNSPQGQVLPPGVAERIRATWMIIQMTFESHDPQVHPSLQLLLQSARAFAESTGGVIADPMSQVYKLPQEMAFPMLDGVTDVRDLVVTHSRPLASGVHLYTSGFEKFNLPELEISGLKPGMEQLGARLLLGVGQTVLRGEQLEIGSSVGEFASSFMVSHGGLDQTFWQGSAVVELIPEQGKDVNILLTEWAKSVGIQ